MKLLIGFFICLISITSLAKEATLVAVVDMGIDYIQHPLVKKHMWESPKLTHGWDFGQKESSSGIDYSFKFEGEYHGTGIAYLLIRNFNKKYNLQKKIKIIDIVYTDYQGYLFNLNSFMYVENMLQVYRRKKAYEKFSDHLGEVFEHAAFSGAKVINFSSGDAGFKSDALEESIKKFSKKAILVVSAGNEGLDLDTYNNYPCKLKLDNVICVGALNKKGKKAQYSNYGKAVDVYTLGHHGGYLEGTSFAAPIISQALAIIAYHHPQWGPLKLKQELFKFISKKNGLPIFNREKFALKYP